MKVRINVSKVSALKAGKDRHGFVAVDVPAESLTPRQRETLAACATSPYQNETVLADFYLDQKFRYSDPYGGIDDTVSDPTPAEVCRLLDHIADVDDRVKAEEAEKAAEKAAEDAEKAAKYAAELAEWRARPVADRIEKRYSGWAPSWDCGDLRGTPEHAEAVAECDRRNAAEQAEAEEAARAKEAAKASGIAALLEWSRTNGSATLRARIEDGYEWQALANQEYAASIVSGLGEQSDSPGDVEDIEDRTTPTLAEIETVRAMRTALEGKPATVSLKWLKYVERDEDDYEPAETVKRCEVCVTVTTPTGHAVEYYYLPKTLATV